MFYPSLEPLKGSEDPAIVDQLDQTLASLYTSGRHRIAPPFISRTLNIPLDAAARVLLKAADAGAGEIAYEVMCAECGVTARTYGELTDVPMEEVHECDSCSQEYAVLPEGVWVSFRITRGPAKKA